ncbi:ECs1072 family phage-associated protein [Providencia rettgeri]|uniref:ECs1072 family phage-associated protein n=1 Tax=Providencia rettgeri TaxID=587 RepID=UPI0016579C0C|nr:hypothetical protein H9L31_04240 [Providencia rettgeri]
MRMLPDLYQHILKKLSPFYNVTYAVKASSSGDKDSLRLHAYMLSLVELFIFQYRKNNSQPFEPLRGDSAIRHILLTKYHLSFEEIDSLSFQQVIFILVKDLSPENFSVEIQDYLKTKATFSSYACIDWSLSINWTLGDGADFLLGHDFD